MEEKLKRKKYNKAIKILTIILLIILIGAVFIYANPFIQTSMNIINGSKAGSVGIIGGTDGPTTIFVANRVYINPITLIFVLLSIIGILYIVFSVKGE